MFRFPLAALLFLTLVAAGPSAHAAVVDASKTTIQWTGKKIFVGTTHTGKAPLRSADVSLTGERISSAKFVVDMTKLTVESVTGGKAKRLLSHLASDDFFAVDKFPTATLVVDRQDTDGKVHGKLTVRGKTQLEARDARKARDAHV